MHIFIIVGKKQIVKVWKPWCALKEVTCAPSVYLCRAPRVQRWNYEE